MWLGGLSNISPVLTRASATNPLQIAVPAIPKTSLLPVSNVRIILSIVGQPYSVRLEDFQNRLGERHRLAAIFV